jgi:putative ABC transport system permease protein
VDIRDALQAVSRGVTGGSQRIPGALISAEVAIAVVLLIAMTMMAKSFGNVQAVAPGFDPGGVLSARVTLPAKRFNNRERIGAFQRLLAERLATLPAVTRAGAITVLPLSGLSNRVPFTVEGRAIARERVPVAQFRTVTPGYFEAAGIPVRRGRTFSEDDNDRTRAVAVVNEELARQWLDGLDPIGARLLVDDNDGPPRPVEIVGVVGNVRQMTLEGEPTWDLYLTYAQMHPDNAGAAAANMFWIVRTARDPMTLVTGVAREVRKIDPDVVASQIRPFDRYLADAMAARRFSLTLMIVFALAAVSLAIAGIYAVVSYSVSQRARELAIRSALGARGNDLLWLVVRQGLTPALVGIAAGVVVAFGTMRALSSLLFGLSATDPGTFAGVAMTLLLVAFAVCIGPGVRATRAAIAAAARSSG